MMSIMLADQLQPAQAAQTKLPAHVEGQEHEGMLVEDGSQQATESGSQASGRWSEAVATGERALPRNASTCLLWCAIALGALVRGCPLSHVGSQGRATAECFRILYCCICPAASDSHFSSF